MDDVIAPDNPAPARTPVAAAALAALDLVVATKPGAEHREGQHEMTAAVADALDRRRHLLVEAPTGTGKSVAYAVAAVLHARRLAEAAPPSDVGADETEERERAPRVVITTATKALQEQLCEEDLPLVQRALSTAGQEFSFALLKGRSNYVCRAKLDEIGAASAPADLLAGSDPTAVERARATALRRLRAWADETDTGDRGDLDEDVADEMWEMVSTTARDCPGAVACHVGVECLAERARARAQGADVVVVNTALYGAHLASGRFVLPPHDAVVVDEAHLCEDVFADQFGVDVHGGRLRHLAASVQRLAPSAKVEGLRRAADRLDAVCEQVAQRDDTRVRACEGELAEILGAAAGAVAEAGRALKDVPAQPGTEAGSSKARVEKAATTLALEIGMALDEARYEANVAWCTAEGRVPRLVMMPVVVGELLASELYPHATVIATSATLAIGGDFDVPAARLGVAADTVHGWDGRVVPSPFDFREQAWLYVPKHLPDPRAATYAEAMAEELHGLVEAAGGRTLALFTSWAAMKATADRCAAHGSYEVLRQGERPRRVLVDALRERAESGGLAVFATMGFWTGVDVAGLGLSLVAIDRIPFPRPNEPLHAARRARAAQAGLDPFATVDVPRAAMLLAQGAGRLIRHRDDRGVVAVLDRRLATAGYRRTLLATMPPFRRSVDGAAVRAFLREITGTTA